MSICVGADATGMRLDKALVRALDVMGIATTRSALARVFKDGGVTYEGQAQKPSHVIEAAGESFVYEVRVPVPKPLRAFPEAIPITVVHDDDDLLVIDKVAGMPVHAGPGHERGNLVNAVLHYLGAQIEALPVLAGNEAYRPGIVHRIDKDTSGLLVVAKHQRALEHLAAQFREHSIDRAYLGLVRGRPSFEALRVETTHARDPSNRRRFAPGVEGATRSAITNIEIIDAGELVSLARFELRTGRTHQIRMHARHLGHPLLGDELYGSSPRDTLVREVGERLGRQALHAARLGFVHPAGMMVVFESPLPADLEAAHEALR